MKLYPICHEHNVQASQNGSCPLCDRWWATYNAALGALLVGMEIGSLNETQAHRRAKQYADRAHGPLPDKQPLGEPLETESVAALVEAAQKLCASEDGASYECTHPPELFEAPAQALKPFEDKS